MSNMQQKDYLSPIVEAIKNINTDLENSGKWIYDEIVATTKILEEQKIYFWIRLYLREENPNIQIGDDVSINWIHSGEKLTTKFISYGKKGLEKDHVGEVTNFSTEDDKKVVCLMVDETKVNFSDEIPFIRTLFKTGKHYEYQLVKREELQFVVERNGIILDYYDCDF